MDLGFCPKGGDLNPEHTCWLMGFPPIWLNCTPLETPSSRKSPRNSSAPRAKPLGPSEMTAMPDHTFHPLADILPMMDEAALAERAAELRESRAITVTRPSLAITVTRPSLPIYCCDPASARDGVCPAL